MQYDFSDNLEQETTSIKPFKKENNQQITAKKQQKLNDFKKNSF